MSFLIDAGMSNLTLTDVDGRDMDRSLMQSLINKLTRYNQVLEMASKRRPREVIEYFIENEEI